MLTVCCGAALLITVLLISLYCFALRDPKKFENPQRLGFSLLFVWVFILGTLTNAVLSVGTAIYLNNGRVQIQNALKTNLTPQLEIQNIAAIRLLRSSGDSARIGIVTKSGMTFETAKTRESTAEKIQQKIILEFQRQGFRPASQ